LNFSTIRNIVTYHLPTLVKIELKKRSPALFYKLPIRPIIASLNITGRCFFNCCMCGIWHNHAGNELKTEEWKDIFKQLQGAGIRYLNFTGGEPLLREDLVELVDYASALGFSISIATNGYLLNEKLALQLKDSGVHCFCISVDAQGESFDRIRGMQGAYQKVHSACKILSKIAKTSNIKVIVYAMVMKSTLGHIMEVVKFAEGLDLPVFFNLLDYTPYFFQPAKDDSLWIDALEQQWLDAVVEELTSVKRQKAWLIAQNYVSLRYIKRYFQDPLQKDIPCSKALTRIFIDPEGLVFGGCWSMGYFGNLREAGLKDIIHSQKYLTAHRKMFLKDCPGCSCGYHTDLKYSLRSLFQEMEFRVFNGFKTLYHNIDLR